VRSRACRKSGEAEWSCERALQKNDGAERRAGVTEIGWSAERFFARSRSAHMVMRSVSSTPSHYSDYTDDNTVNGTMGT